MRVDTKTTRCRSTILVGLVALGVAAATPAGEARAATREVVVCDASETAGIDGRSWDKSFPGARTVDAAHRRVLVRFPGAARLIEERLARGFTIARAEIVFPFEGVQLKGHGYDVQFRDRWVKDPPQWHVTARGLRRAWSARKELAPTYNAYIKGAGYWTKYGAQDPVEDLIGEAFTPVEVSSRNPEGRMDITRALTERAFGFSLGERLRGLEERGFVLGKLEAWDARYRDWSSYEWEMATGGCGLTFANPRLEVTLVRAASAQRVALPPATDVEALAARLKSSGDGGSPTLVWPTQGQLEKLVAKHGHFQRKPDDMPAWQWQRILELRKIGGGRISQYSELLEAADLKGYRKLVATLLKRPPRVWRGWGTQDELLLWYLYRDVLPPNVRDYMREFWRCWLHPDTPTDEMIFPQGSAARGWFKKHGDWRGRASFFRNGFCYRESTMNFNHTAAMGALLGGSMIGSKYAMADGRHCLINFPLRHWSYLDGTSQEMLDHYYFSITVSGQKMFADFGPTRMDRLMGRMIMDRALELLASSYHPELRRCVGASGRARIPGILGVEQDGIYHALHAMSKKGVLLHLDAKPVKQRKARTEPMMYGMALFGYDFPGGRAAIQSLTGPWHDEWFTNVIDEKQLPYSIVAADTVRGLYNPPLWKVAYLGRHYGLASLDVSRGSVPVVAQWSNDGAVADHVDDRRTLTMRFSINRPRMTETHGGNMARCGGMYTYQYRNKAFFCTKPFTEKEPTLKIAGNDGLRNLSTTAALWSLGEERTWRMYVNGTPVETLPARARGGDVITIHDGVSYVGLIPIPATDLGRTDEVVIKPGTPDVLRDRHKNTKVAPAVVIESYNMQRDEPLPAEDPLWDRINRYTYGGFVVEVGDETEHGSFERFQEHMNAARFEARYVEKGNGVAFDRTLHLKYASGDDRLEMGFRTDIATDNPHGPIQPGTNSLLLPYRRANGRWPYLPLGFKRDTTLTQQGDGGALTKNGATLRFEAGCKGYLQTEPITGTYVASNPLPEECHWELDVPGGMRLVADGKLGLARVTVVPGENTIDIAHARREGDFRIELASALVVTGAKAPPRVKHFGEVYDGAIPTVRLGDATAYVVPLTPDGVTGPQLAAIPERVAESARILGR